MQEKEHIKNILDKTLKALKNYNSIELKDLSDQTIHTASITQDPDNIAVAVILYSLSKLIERTSYRSQKNWDKVLKKTIVGVEHCLDAINNNADDHLRKHLESLRKSLEGFSGSLKKYIEDVFRKASINKASKIYSHGISLEKTAKLLGVSLWELSEYAGQKVEDTDLQKTVSTKQRLKLAMEMFS